MRERVMSNIYFSECDGRAIPNNCPADFISTEWQDFAELLADIAIKQLNQLPNPIRVEKNDV
jgi:hypothetical protein